MTLLNEQIAKHVSEVYFGDNWTDVNIKDTLEDISWQEAITKIPNLHTIASLVFHLNYNVTPALHVLKG